MSGFADYQGYDAIGLAELVANGEMTPADLLDAAIDRFAAQSRPSPFVGYTARFAQFSAKDRKVRNRLFLSANALGRCGRVE